jgi:hypothetical protein
MTLATFPTLVSTFTLPFIPRQNYFPKSKATLMVSLWIKFNLLSIAYYSYDYVPLLCKDSNACTALSPLKDCGHTIYHGKPAVYPLFDLCMISICCRLVAHPLLSRSNCLPLLRTLSGSAVKPDRQNSGREGLGRRDRLCHLQSR